MKKKSGWMGGKKSRQETDKERFSEFCTEAAPYNGIMVVRGKNNRFI